MGGVVVEIREIMGYYLGKCGGTDLAQNVLWMSMKSFSRVPVRSSFKVFRGRACVALVEEKFWMDRIRDRKSKDIWDRERAPWLPPTLANFNFLLKHNCLLTGMRLYKIGLEVDGTCRVCKQDSEGLYHLFFYCEGLWDFLAWLKRLVGRWARGKRRTELEQWESLFLFGFSKAGRDKLLLELAQSLARYSIWTRRNTARHKGVVVCVRRLFTVGFRAVVDLLFFDARQLSVDLVGLRSACADLL